jgi:acyl-homoserine-lactone acylase
VNLRELEAFYSKDTTTLALNRESPEGEPEPSGSNGMAIAPVNTANHHALLLINPTHFIPLPV